MIDLYLIKTVIVFFLIVFFLLLIYRFSYRFSFPFKPDNKGEIVIKELKYVGKNKTLVLVKVKDSEFLLSCDEGNIRKIKEWVDEEDNNPPATG